MRPLLEQIYHEGIFPAEEIMPTDPAYDQVTDQLETVSQQLKAAVSPHLASQVELFEDLHIQAADLLCAAAFVYGFRLGVQMMEAAPFPDSLEK